jgi:microcystin-dependent protein
MFIGEIRMFAGNFPPQDWAFCDGSLQLISENEALFALIGTTYGGDGMMTFALPDFRGRVPVHRSNTHPLGSSGGQEEVTLTGDQLPGHTHLVSASSSAPPPATSAIDITGPVPYVPASPAAKPRLYAATGATVPMAAGIVQASGGGQAHNNMAPYLGINFIIQLYGVFPVQS